MTDLLRLIFRSCCACCLAAAAVRGNPEVPGPALDGIPPELAALLELPRWSNSVSVTTGFGYKDNVLLSHDAEERSAFARGGVELLLWHLPRGGMDYSAFISAEGTRYLSGVTVDDESQAFGQFEWRHRWGESLKVALALQGYHLDQVFDVSDTDVQRLVAELRVNGVSGGPTVRWAFRPTWFVEAQGVGKREKFHDRSNDARLREGAFRLGWRPGTRIEAMVSVLERRRQYDRRVQYTTGGRPLGETLLFMTEREGSARFEITLDRARRWKTETRAGEVRYEDNGSGYFNYRQRSVTQRLAWRSERWSIAVEGTAGRLDFEVQTVGFGMSPPARIKEEFSAELSVERKLSSRWTALAQHRWERSRCNDPIASYRMNESLLGARWSWEK